MKSLSLLLLTTTFMCSARNPFESLIDEMKHFEQKIEDAFRHHVKGDYHSDLMDFSIKDEDAHVILTTKVNGIEKDKVTVKAHEGILTAVIPTKEGKTTLQANKHAVTLYCEQQITHETKDASGKLLATRKSTAVNSQTQPLPSDVDIMNVVKVEVSDDAVIITLAKAEAKQFPIIIV